VSNAARCRVQFELPPCAEAKAELGLAALLGTFEERRLSLDEDVGQWAESAGRTVPARRRECRTGSLITAIQFGTFDPTVSPFMKSSNEVPIKKAYLEPEFVVYGGLTDLTLSRAGGPTTSPSRRKNHPNGILLAVVLQLAIAFLLLQSSYSLRGLEQNPAGVGGGKK
jgi:hypothetical protein